MKKVLIISYYYPPSGGSGVQRWMYFSKYLGEFGIDPYIITVDEKHASYKFIDNKFLEHVKDVHVYRTKTLEPLRMYSKMLSGDERLSIPQGFAGESKPGLFRKLSRFIRGNFFIPDARIGWNRYAYHKAKEIIEKENIELVITNGTPHSTHLIGLKLKKKLGVKWICDLRDPWTEAYYNKDLFRTSIARTIDARMEREVLAKADMVTTIGPGMVKLLNKKLPSGEHSKVHFVYNGYDAELFKGLEKQPTNKFVILHLGILSESQPILSFIKVLKSVIDQVEEMKNNLIVRFVGKVSPSILSEMNQYIPEVNYEQIDYVPHSEAIQYMLNANLLLNSLADTQESELLISGKLMEYVASGNPILVLGNPEGDAANLLKTVDRAKVFDRQNTNGMDSFLIDIYSRWSGGERYPKGDFYMYSRHETTRIYAKLIDELI